MREQPTDDGVSCEDGDRHSKATGKYGRRALMLRLAAGVGTTAGLTALQTTASATRGSAVLTGDTNTTTYTTEDPTSGSPIDLCDYTIFQESAVYTAYDRYGNVVTTNSTPDIGPILNTLISNLIEGSNNGGVPVGGRIYIGPGQFIVQPGADNANFTTDPNSTNNSYLVYIPVTTAFIPIAIIGNGVGAIGQIYGATTNVSTGPTVSTGTQLYCPITENTSTISSAVLGAMYSSEAAHNFTQVALYLDGLRFTLASNQFNVGGVNVSRCSNFCAGSLAFDIQLSNASSIPQPGSTYNAALSLPTTYGQGPYLMNWVAVAGYYIGIQISEHAVISSLYLQSCMNAIVLSADTQHANIILRALIQECPIHVDNAVSGGGLSILALDAETQTGENSWQKFSSVFSSSTKQVKGDIHWNQVTYTGDNSTDDPGAIPPGVRWNYNGQPISPSSSTAGTSPYNYRLQYNAVFVITKVGGMSSLKLDNQALFGGSFAAGQQVTLYANHTLAVKWATTAPAFKILPF
jgi:hypothetical protein